MGVQGKTLAVYAGLGPQLLHYAVDVTRLTLSQRNDFVSLPANVQYACASGANLYVASSNGGPGLSGDVHYVTSFRIDSITGVLNQNGRSIPLRFRPIHITADRTGEHILIAYNNPSGLTVHRITPDGSVGDEVEQSAALDTGVFPHQIFMTPSTRAAILVTRGNDAARGRPEDPGALKRFKYCRGALTNAGVVSPNGGFGFGPRNIAFNPSTSCIYASLERQNKLSVFRVEADDVAPEPSFQVETLVDRISPGRQQLAGAVRVHPNGRFVYLANRASGSTEHSGEQTFAGGENTIAVYSIDGRSGEPRMIQSIDTGGISPRTFSIDPAGRMLVVGNSKAMLVQDGSITTMMPANLSVFGIGADGRLTAADRYQVVSNREQLFWSGMAVH